MKSLTWKRDGNANEYYLDGVLIARHLVRTSHPQEHLIDVCSRIRIYPGVDPSYMEARKIWDARTEAK